MYLVFILPPSPAERPPAQGTGWGHHPLEECHPLFSILLNYEWWLTQSSGGIHAVPVYLGGLAGPSRLDAVGSPPPQTVSASCWPQPPKQTFLGHVVSAPAARASWHNLVTPLGQKPFPVQKSHDLDPLVLWTLFPSPPPGYTGRVSASSGCCQRHLIRRQRPPIVTQIINTYSYL